jgi:hypothetical protein
LPRYLVPASLLTPVLFHLRQARNHLDLSGSLIA